MEGFSFAIQHSDLPVAMRLDSLEAVTMLECRNVDRSGYAFVVNDIKLLWGLGRAAKF